MMKVLGIVAAVFAPLHAFMAGSWFERGNIDKSAFNGATAIFYAAVLIAILFYSRRMSRS